MRVSLIILLSMALPYFVPMGVAGTLEPVSGFHVHLNLPKRVAPISWGQLAAAQTPSFAEMVKAAKIKLSRNQIEELAKTGHLLGVIPIQFLPVRQPDGLLEVAPGTIEAIRSADHGLHFNAGGLDRQFFALYRLRLLDLSDPVEREKALDLVRATRGNLAGAPRGAGGSGGAGAEETAGGLPVAQAKRPISCGEDRGCSVSCEMMVQSDPVFGLMAPTVDCPWGSGVPNTTPTMVGGIVNTVNSLAETLVEKGAVVCHFRGPCDGKIATIDGFNLYATAAEAASANQPKTGGAAASTSVSMNYSEILACNKSRSLGNPFSIPIELHIGGATTSAVTSSTTVATSSATAYKAAISASLTPGRMPGVSASASASDAKTIRTVGYQKEIDLVDKAAQSASSTGTAVANLLDQWYIAPRMIASKWSSVTAGACAVSYTKGANASTSGSVEGKVDLANAACVVSDCMSIPTNPQPDGISTVIRPTR